VKSPLCLIQYCTSCLLQSNVQEFKTCLPTEAELLSTTEIYRNDTKMCLLHNTECKTHICVLFRVLNKWDIDFNSRHIYDTRDNYVGLQMDVDSEDDQMMQAIALSLGQNVSTLESEVECTSCTET